MKTAFDFSTWYREGRQLVAAHGCFDITLTPLSVRWHYDEAKPLRCHRTILRPLLEHCSECYVYGVKKRSTMDRLLSGISHPAKGKHQLQLGIDVITGREFLWNATGWQRGSILIIGRLPKSVLKQVFSASYQVGVTEHFRSGHSAAAITFARQSTLNTDQLAFLLPASNGVEWLTIIGHPKRVSAAFRMAAKSVRLPKRARAWYECEDT